MAELIPSKYSLPARPRDGHKGTFGRVAVIGGSVGMSGSVTLAAVAALRGGAGLVTAVVPQNIQAVVAAYEPSCMTIGLPVDDSGELRQPAQEDLNRILGGMTAIGAGPGLGRSDGAASIIEFLLAHRTQSVVLDADGLNLIAERRLSLQSSAGKPGLVLTPHPGEFSRLTERSPEEIGGNREQMAAEYALEHGVVLVLKGAGTVVTDGERIFVNSTGNSGMATGGSGDVLTGIVSSQLAAGMPEFEAACLAVHVHGLAGDLAAEELSERGLIASDLIRFLGPAWRQLESRTSGT
ncbi:MAG: NAD(P)H-hydrate dehydratase [Planctomycetaceae bacterium]|nr:NAD(P)H-hydrate dehydratase [Planctomycetaceae bacterium]